MTPTILFEDDWLLALDKPSGMAVHTGAGVVDGTVNDWVRDHLGRRAVRNGFPASIAHRLDRETSGVVLVALRRPAMRALALAFEERRVRKEYLTLVRGVMPTSTGRIDRPLPDEGGRERDAATGWEVLEAFKTASLLRVKPETGRKHQIRRHLAAIAHPVAGDEVHGDVTFNATARATWPLKRLFLHAATIGFAHPRDGHPMEVVASLPADLEAVLERLRRPV